MKAYCNNCQKNTETISRCDCVRCGLSKTDINLTESKLKLAIKALEDIRECSYGDEAIMNNIAFDTLEKIGNLKGKEK